MTESSPRSEAAGSENARIDWTAALAEHGRWLRTVILARVGEAQAVDEVLQEVSLAAVAERAPLRDAGKVAPWLYRLAVTQSLLYRRKVGRQRKLLDRFTERVPPREGDCGAGDPLGWLLADERRRMVRVALKRMASRDAEILLLKYTEDWSYRDLAERLGVTVSAVEARLHRARARMREELAALEAAEAINPSVGEPHADSPRRLQAKSLGEMATVEK